MKFLERLQWKRNFWRKCFLDHHDKPTAEGSRALHELATFCYANKPGAKVARSGALDPLAMAIAEGRREVFLHIVNHLNLDNAAFNRLLTQHQQEHEE